MLVATKVKMSGSKKNASSKSYNISSMKRVTRKFHIVVVQNNGQEMYKKVCYTCKSCFFFWLIRPIDFFVVLVVVAVEHYTILFFV